MLPRLLFRLSSWLPLREIPGPHGEPYLERYFLFQLFACWPRLTTTAYLHRYLAPDPGRNLHNHPWPWAIGIPLSGGYLERRLCWIDTGIVSKLRRIRWLQPNVLVAGSFHRIETIQPGKTWTLFIHGPRTKHWGFLRAIGLGKFEIVPGDPKGVGRRAWWKTAKRRIDKESGDR